MLLARRNPVQTFIRNTIRLVLGIPLWLLFALRDFQTMWNELTAFAAGPDWVMSFFVGILKTFVILWLVNIVAGMMYILPQWERLVLLRLGKSVGARGPGLFIVPPFIYSVARIIDVRITTYEVKATKKSY